MTTFLIFLILIFLVLIYAGHKGLFSLGDKKLNIRNAVTEEKVPYEKKPYLMTNAERAFFKVLHEAVGDRYYIVPQVPLKNIVQVNKYERLRKTYQNKIDRKCLDFVLFDPEYFTPQVVIELDDSSHGLPFRQERDRFVDAIMAKVGLRIEHIKTAYNYDLNEISAKLATYGNNIANEKPLNN